MAVTKVLVVDYGMGNICSVVNAFRYLGVDPVVSHESHEISKADSLILPGVGSFFKAMKTLRDTGIEQAILESVIGKGRKILGICLGMQLLGSHGCEDGDIPGLGIIPSQVQRFTPLEVGPKKVPHIGFNEVLSRQDSLLFYGLPRTSDFYFVHSYRMLADNLHGKAAICNYGVDFLAAYEVDNVYATQFHPEKSQTNGLILIRNFLRQ
ncbi:MAG: imidazole glycerol phosphate synthase subunit HisH [Oligoflexales bacterium]|nr:imidazole glycerol phosphate synthase subunit HisH [Oligoflexales bacterium]